MQLLDAILAFALTMAALATVATIIMEICLRIARMRKKNFIQVMKLLNEELGKGTLKMSDDERWAFFVRVIENPTEGVKKIPELEWKNKSLEERISSYGKNKKWSGLYEKVSLEYMLRCLAETEYVKKGSREASARIKVEFNRIARKYEEFGSAVSASFKQYAQFWSIAIGVALAIAANIDGVRIFESYKTDPELASAVIEKHETFLKSHQEAQESLKDFNALEEKVASLEKKVEEAKEKKANNIKELEQELETAKAALAEKVDLKNIQLKARQARQQVTDLIAMGVPLGWDFYPNCPYGKSENAWATSSPGCKAIPVEDHKKIWAEPEKLGSGVAGVLNTVRYDFAGFFVWLLKVFITGILIGLGAPFWFDVAKRLAQLRKGLQKETASTEYRLSASNANGDPKKRKEIVENVLADAADEAGASKSGETVSFLGPKALRL
jgi:hypothetical protein